MCRFCDLNVLDPASFDSFFGKASTQGLKTMVCRHCSTTFLTEFVLIANEPPDNPPPTIPEAEKNNYILLSH
jgi:hypothetical protein